MRTQRILRESSEHRTIRIMAKIAIIEDDLAIAQMYRMKFEVEGYDVETAENGLLGFKLIRDKKPDVILLDLMMPEMNGEEVLEKVRAEAWGKDIKVIILTNLSAQEAPAKLKELGVKKYIVKAEMTPKQVAEVVKAELKKK